MNYQEKLERMEQHLIEHPHDYQTKIAMMKMRGKAIEKARFQQMIPKLQAAAHARMLLRLEEEDAETY